MDKKGNWSITNVRHGHYLDLYFHSIYIICYVYVGIKSQNLINKQYRVTWSMTNAYFGHFFDIMRDCFVSLAMKITHGTEEASFIITNFPSKLPRFNFTFFLQNFPDEIKMDLILNDLETKSQTLYKENKYKEVSAHA